MFELNQSAEEEIQKPSGLRERKIEPLIIQ